MPVKSAAWTRLRVVHEFSYARLACAVGAAEEPAARLHAVTHDAALAVLADRRHLLDRALEGVEHMYGALRVYLEGHAVVVATDFASSHKVPHPREKVIIHSLPAAHSGKSETSPAVGGRGRATDG